MSLDPPTLRFWLSIALAAAAAGMLFREPLYRGTRMLLLLALLVLVVASTNAAFTISRTARVVVMVDLSPSTRGAAYRMSLNDRLGQLLGTQPHEILYFGDETSATPPARLTDDLPARVTRFAPPPNADAVLLFSDGQFAPPAFTPPVFAVIDPGLEQLRDARIVDVTQRGDAIDITTANTGGPRTLSIAGGEKREVPIGTRTLRIAADVPSSMVVSLDAGDRWPENDTMSFAAIASRSGRLWIGPDSPRDYLQVPAGAAVDVGSLVGIEAIVLHNTTAAEVPEAAMRAIEQYVRLLGGTLVINGGAGAFAAGGWTGTPIDDISPLSASPPTPQRLWMLVVDASGSMAAATPDGIRLTAALAAAKSALERLPPNDQAVIGTFADRLTWLTPTPESVRSLRERPLAPTEPRGPTNLDAMLQALAGSESRLPRELLIISDGEAQGPISVTSEQLKVSQIRPSVLLIGPGDRAKTLLDLVADSGGSIVSASDSGTWVAAAQQLARLRSQEAWLAREFEVELSGPLAGERFGVPGAAETWLRDGATRLGNFTSATYPAAATWQVGSGRVIALAFESPDSVLAKAVEQFAMPSRDSRFSVSVRHSDQDVIEVTGAEGGRPINELALALGFEGGATTQLTQLGPGRYSAAVERSPAVRVAEITAGASVIERIVLPARYTAEFESVGLDFDRLKSLAEGSGGRLVATTETSPLTFPTQRRNIYIAPWANAFAAAITLAALITEHSERRRQSEWNTGRKPG